MISSEAFPPRGDFLPWPFLFSPAQTAFGFYQHVPDGATMYYFPLIFFSTIPLTGFCRALIVPPEYKCPITESLFVDPVLLADGYTYERAAIQEWLQTNTTSPITEQVPVKKNHHPQALSPCFGWIPVDSLHLNQTYLPGTKSLIELRDNW